MIEEWRIFLYLPLGILASFFFTLRFLVQWVKSEKAGVSYVNKTFWNLSISGNILLFIHYSIQGQYPFALIQTGNALISWRNLNLMKGATHLSFRKTLFIFACVLLTTIFLFIFFIGNEDWIRVPQTSFFAIVRDPGFFWHGLGFLGQGLFASRFWLQWWSAERNQKSELGVLFWWISLIGAFLSAIYFLRIRDLVSFLSQSFGLIPYVRNLILIKKNQVAPQ